MGVAGGEKERGARETGVKDFKRYFCIFLSIVWFCVLPVFAEQPKFRFGISTPFSGILAEYGTAVRNGIELAVKEHPEEMSHIELLYEDSQWDPKTAVTAFNTLQNIKKAALIYNWGNPTSEAVAPIAERLKFPLIVMSSDHTIALHKNYVVRSLGSAELFGKLLARYLISKNFKKLGVVIAENSYVQGIYDGLEAELKGTDVSLERLASFGIADQDFRSTVSRLRTKSFDCLGVLLISGQVQTFFKQLDAQKISIPAFGADFFGSKTEIEASGPGIEGAVFPDLKITEEFRQKYMKAYDGNDVQVSFAANAYDVAVTVAKVFGTRGSGALSSQEIITKLKNAPGLNGAHGSFIFEDSPEYGPAFVTPIVIRQVQNGGIVDLSF